MISPVFWLLPNRAKTRTPTKQGCAPVAVCLASIYPRDLINHVDMSIVFPPSPETAKLLAALGLAIIALVIFAPYVITPIPSALKQRLAELEELVPERFRLQPAGKDTLSVTENDFSDLARVARVLIMATAETKPYINLTRLGASIVIWQKLQRWQINFELRAAELIETLSNQLDSSPNIPYRELLRHKIDHCGRLLDVVDNSMSALSERIEHFQVRAHVFAATMALLAAAIALLW